jgi:3-hydroxyacyl-[acyl-carrier-protein] dehydratase
MNQAGATTIEAFDIQKLLKYLPHRYPFLMIDRVVDLRGDEFGIGLKNVTVNEPQFQGHFPERPVMPGVLLVEGMAQTAGVVCMHAHLDPSKPPPVVYFLTIDKAKFRKPVVPGDQVAFHMRRTKLRKTMFWFEGRAFVDGTLVCEAEIGATIVPD